LRHVFLSLVLLTTFPLPAQARCHRIGQTKEVKVYRLITSKTYEQKMFERASMKLGLDQAVLSNMRSGRDGGRSSAADHGDGADAGGGGGNSKAANQLSKHDIDQLLKYGAYDIFKDDDEAAKKFVEQDIEDILLTRSKVLVSKVDESIAEHGAFFPLLSSFFGVSWPVQIFLPYRHSHD
jgi:hypothetical protein